MAGWVLRTLRLPTVAGAVLAAFTLAVTGAVAGEPASAVPSPGALRVLQMNLCDSGLARCYTGRSVAEASEVIRAETPDVVTVNEVCRDDVPALEHALAGAEGDVVVSAFQAAWDRRTGAAIRCRNGQPYGIALVTRGSGAAGGYDAVGAAYPVQDAGSAERRAWLCLHPRRPATGPAVVVCTTHLASGSAPVARAQCAYLIGTAIPAVRARAGSTPVVLGGDLNLRSADATDGTCLPADDRRADDGHVQHVVATPGLTVGQPRTIAMPATDHPGLLVTLSAADQ